MPSPTAASCAAEKLIVSFAASKVVHTFPPTVTDFNFALPGARSLTTTPPAGAAAAAVTPCEAPSPHAFGNVTLHAIELVVAMLDFRVMDTRP